MNKWDDKIEKHYVPLTAAEIDRREYTKPAPGRVQDGLQVNAPVLGLLGVKFGEGELETFKKIVEEVFANPEE